MISKNIQTKKIVLKFTQTNIVHNVICFNNFNFFNYKIVNFSMNIIILAIKIFIFVNYFELILFFSLKQFFNYINFLLFLDCFVNSDTICYVNI